MPNDPIVDEVRKFRDQHAAKFGYDLRAIAEDARKREQQCGRQVVSLKQQTDNIDIISGQVT
ncbi:MAG: hypothetical protein WCJ35_23640 [Planctomycetota bacterium]